MTEREEMWADFLAAVGYDYVEMADEWLRLSPAELIEKADDIAAANRMYLNAKYCVRDEDVPNLLELKHPLKFLADTWKEWVEGTVMEMQDAVSYAIDQDALDDYERTDNSPSVRME